jgi:hypothetical protein
MARAPSSSLVQDTCLSRMQHGFESRRGHSLPSTAERGLDATPRLRGCERIGRGEQRTKIERMQPVSKKPLASLRSLGFVLRNRFLHSLSARFPFCHRGRYVGESGFSVRVGRGILDPAPGPAYLGTSRTLATFRRLPASIRHLVCYWAPSQNWNRTGSTPGPPRELGLRRRPPDDRIIPHESTTARGTGGGRTFLIVSPGRPRSGAGRVAPHHAERILPPMP